MSSSFYLSQPAIFIHFFTETYEQAIFYRFSQYLKDKEDIIYFLAIYLFFFTISVMEKKRLSLLIINALN